MAMEPTKGSEIDDEKCRYPHFFGKKIWDLFFRAAPFLVALSLAGGTEDDF